MCGDSQVGMEIVHLKICETKSNLLMNTQKIQVFWYIVGCLPESTLALFILVLKSPTLLTLWPVWPFQTLWPPCPAFPVVQSVDNCFLGQHALPHGLFGLRRANLADMSRRIARPNLCGHSDWAGEDEGFLGL